MDPALREGQGLRIAVEGCGHGTLDAIYASVGKACKVRGWDSVDLLIIGGDFQSVRNASDLTVMSCPVKYREIGDFHAYYSGATKAPYLTIFVGGNHEASSHLWELFYGGWVAPNIYYMGAANVVRLGGLRIAGMSGIWKGYNFKKTHYERLPYSEDDIKSIYHVREIDVRKLLQLRTQIDIGISHDWPRAIENHGHAKSLWSMKPDFERESKEGTLGSLAAAYVMDRLRPPYWFSAHMHCKFAAIKTYEAPNSNGAPAPAPARALISGPQNTVQPVTLAARHNSDEIDLDMDEEQLPPAQPVASNRAAVANQDEITFDEDEDELTDHVHGVGAASHQGEISSEDADTPRSAPVSSVSSELRAQLPAAFSRPAIPLMRAGVEPKIPADITNKTVRFLALDKCLPRRKFLQLLEIRPHGEVGKSASMDGPRPKPEFEYDPEWLAITRAFASHMIFGSKSARTPEDLGEANYRRLIEREQAWVEEHVVRKGKLGIPENFSPTAPVFVVGTPAIVEDGPVEYNNPQTQEFCDLLGMENQFSSSEEERQERMRRGPPPLERRHDGGVGGRGRGGRGGRGGLESMLPFPLPRYGLLLAQQGHAATGGTWHVSRVTCHVSRAPGDPSVRDEGLSPSEMHAMTLDPRPSILDPQRALPSSETLAHLTCHTALRARPFLPGLSARPFCPTRTRSGSGLLLGCSAARLLCCSAPLLLGSSTALGHLPPAICHRPSATPHRHLHRHPHRPPSAPCHDSGAIVAMILAQTPAYIPLGSNSSHAPSQDPGDASLRIAVHCVAGISGISRISRISTISPISPISP
ncbi:hypothetical protein JHW43_008390 [Diplocarpon mali]|nr:hypothetical protein JHW43_008390 [Diplocarpon mali]